MAAKDEAGHVLLHKARDASRVRCLCMLKTVYTKNTHVWQSRIPGSGFGRAKQRQSRQNHVVGPKLDHRRSGSFGSWRDGYDLTMMSIALARLSRLGPGRARLESP